MGAMQLRPARHALLSWEILGLGHGGTLAPAAAHALHMPPMPHSRLARHGRHAACLLIPNQP